MVKKITVLTPTGDCLTCGYKKGMNSPFKGKKIGYPPGGKCTREGGFCEAVKKEKGASPRRPPKPLPRTRQSPVTKLSVANIP